MFIEKVPCHQSLVGIGTKVDTIQKIKSKEKSEKKCPYRIVETVKDHV